MPKRRTKRRIPRRKSRHVKKGGVWPFTRKNKVVPQAAPFPSQEIPENQNITMNDFLNEDMERIGVLGEGKSTDYNVCITKYPPSKEEDAKYECTKTHIENNKCVPDDMANIYYNCDLDADFRCKTIKSANGGVVVLPCGIKKNHLNFIWSELTKTNNIDSLKDKIQKTKENKFLNMGLEGLKKDVFNYVKGMVYIPKGSENDISEHRLTKFNMEQLKAVSFFNYLTKEEVNELQRSIGGIIDNLANNKTIPPVERMKQDTSDVYQEAENIEEEPPTIGGNKRKRTHRRKFRKN